MAAKGGLAKAWLAAGTSAFAKASADTRFL
jgi:hypothetical protein